MGSSASTNNNTKSQPPRPKSSPPQRRKAVQNGDAGGGQTRDAPKSAEVQDKTDEKLVITKWEPAKDEQTKEDESKSTEQTVVNGDTKHIQENVNTKEEAARTTNPGDPPNYHRSQIPPPRPPRTAKADIFTTSKYKEVDDYVLNAPPKLLVGNFNELVKYLTRDNERWDDMCKLRAIFLWVTSIDVYNLKVDGVPPTHSPLEYFTKIQCNMGNHAHLISGLCQMAGVPCVIISGMNKSAAYDIGSKCDRKSMGAQWNAVYINDDWRFLDAFWASACVVGRKSGEWTLVDSDGNVTQEDEETSEGTTQHRINEFYFLPDPDKLIWTHFPDEPQWQLLDRPVTQREFEEHVYMRERFHYLGMKLMPNSHDKCLLSAKEGELELVFSLPVQQSETSRFKYMLYQGKGERGEQQADDLFLDRFVMFEHTANLLRFTLRFPIKGKFKMDVFGLDINESDIFDLACTYIINCNEPKANCLPLPDLPPIGWGPGANAKEAGLKPITHDGAIIVTKDGNVEIRLAADKDIQLHQMLKHALIDEATLSNYAVTRLENGEAVVNIRLPQGGEYALKLYADAAGNEGSAPNVLNYLIKSDAKGIHNQPFPNVADGTLGKKPSANNLGVKAISHKGGNIQAKNGRARVEFQARAGVQVMVELHSSDEMACKTMAVTPKEENGKWTFDLDMPDKGEYSLNVFACNKNSTDRIYNVHTYLVHSEGRKLEPGELDARNENKNVLTNIPIETVQTSDNEVLIPVPPGFENVAAALNRRNANDPPNANQVDIIEQDGMQLIRAKLPEFGEYMLNLYDRDTSGVVRNIAKYQINRKPPGELYEDNTKMLMSNLGAQAPIMEEDEEEYAPVKLDRNETDEEKKKRLEEEQRRATRRQIQKAIDMKDSEMLERYIQQYEKLNPSFDDELLQKARRTLNALDAKEALTEACQRRDLDSLKKAITRAKEANFDHQLDLQLALANRLKDQLERIEKLRHSVLNLDTKTIAEIKTYSNPPDGVHQSMMATFILLGNTPKEVKSWRTCQALVGKTGRESLMRRISSFDPKDCNIGVAQQAKFYIDDYSMSQIRDVSAGAATFYGWLREFVREVTNLVLCQPTKRNLARFNCKTGRREFTPDDNEQPGPSTEPSVTPTDKSNNLLRKQRSLSGKHMHLSISATESINLQPKGNDKRSKTALSNTGRNRFNDDIAKDVRHLEKHVTLGNDIQRSRTALPDTGRSRFTDDIAKDVGHLEKHKPTSLNKIDDCNKIQKSNIEKKHTTMLVLSSMSDSSIDDNPAGMQTDMIQQCQDGILNQVEHLDSRLAEIGSTAIEPKYTDKKDTNRKFSSVYLSENTDDSETDADDKETIVGKLNINDRESFQNDINNTDFHINTSVECFHEGDRKRHARKSSTDDGNTSVFRNTQLSYTPVHCRKINNDVGDEISNSKTSKESPEFKDSKDEESICNDNNSPLVECVAIFSTDNEHSEANTGDNLTSSFETIIKACSNILGADDGTITLKEIDNDIINKKQNPSRTSSRLVIDATNSYSCTPDNIPGHEIKEGTLSGEIKIMQEHKLTDSFKHGTYDNLETAMSPISDKNKKCDGLKEEHKTFGENNGGGNDTFPAYACASKAETRIGAINYSMTGLDGNNDGAARTLRNGFVSLENKIVIPTDFGEDSSDFDQTDSEYEAETAASKHSDDDVAELKALLEMTTCRRAENVKIDNLDKEPEKIEITNGQPSEDYVQFVREKTMDTTKAKKIKKVKARKNDKKEKIHKSVIPHERNAKTKPTDDARQKKVVTKKPKTTHKQDSTKKTKKKSKQV